MIFYTAVSTSLYYIEYLRKASGFIIRDGMRDYDIGNIIGSTSYIDCRDPIWCPGHGLQFWGKE